MRYIRFAPAFTAALLLFPIAIAVYVLAELWEVVVVGSLVYSVSRCFVLIEYRAFKPIIRWLKQQRQQFDSAKKGAPP